MSAVSTCTAAGASAGTQHDLGTLLLDRAAELGEKTAYFFVRSDGASRGVSYARLAAEAKTLAATLRRHPNATRPVILAFEPGLDFIVSLWACFIAGVPAVPVRPPRDSSALRAFRAIVSDCAAELVLCDDQSMKRFEQAVGRDASLRQMHWWPCCSGEPSDGGIASVSHATRTEIALLQYTSGSTGDPKGVMVSHRNVIQNEDAILRRFGHDAQTIVVNCLPHYHDMGLVGGLLQPIYAGGQCIMISPAAVAQRPLLWLETISRFRATTSGAPARTYARCAERAAAARDLDLTSWSVAFVGAEPVRRWALEAFERRYSSHGFSAAAFLPCYGLAEATLFVCAPKRNRLPEFDDESDSALAGCGYPGQGVELRIVDPARCEVLQDGCRGEIWVRGPQIALGYFDDARATQQAFRAFTASGEGPFLRTGDIGYVKSDNLFICGRIKSTIIVDGVNYAAEDIEESAARCIGPSAVVAAFPIDATAGEEVVVVAEASRERGSDDADAALSERIARQVTQDNGVAPAVVVLAAQGSIPRTSSGKIRREACRDRYVAGELRDTFQRLRPADETTTVDDEPPRTRLTLERWLIETIATRTGTNPSQIDPEVTFPALGLDSRDLFSLAEQLSMSIGCEIDPALLWECPTVRTLATRILPEHAAN